MRIRYLFEEERVRQSDKDYIEKRLEKIRTMLGNYKDDEVMFEVEVDQDKKGVWKLELMIQAPHVLYRAEKEDQELTVAMDQAEEAILQQIRKNKDKVKDLRERGRRSIKKKITIDDGARF